MRFAEKINKLPSKLGGVPRRSLLGCSVLFSAVTVRKRGGTVRVDAEYY
jgi:hypothetical protein